MTVTELSTLIESGHMLDAQAALAVLQWPDNNLEALLGVTKVLRQRHFGFRVACCGIVNARSGRCGEDCRFCAQSAHHDTTVEAYDLLAAADLLKARAAFPGDLRGRFGLVTSGGALSNAELSRLETLIAQHPDPRVDWCASLGMLDEAAFRRLKAAGLRRYHHNLETAASHFPAICATHTFEQRVATVKAAKRAGLEVCCGALFGLGESPAQRVELALTLRELAVDAVPLNFLMPVPGTPLAETPPDFSEADILRIIAMFRLVLPKTPIRVCGGREHYLSGQAMGRIFDAGATGIMIGGYLTRRGREVEDDLAMIQAAGYEAEGVADALGR